MTFGSPIGSSLYLIFPFIDDLSLAPISSADDPYDVRPPGKANRQYAAINNAEAEVALLALAMRAVLGDDTLRIPERTLSLVERNPVLLDVLPVLSNVPVERGSAHALR